VGEECFWALCGAKLMVENCYGPYKAFQEILPRHLPGELSGIKEIFMINPNSFGRGYISGF
jgi:hypothetical protein